jgi:hypothetical protein
MKTFNSVILTTALLLGVYHQTQAQGTSAFTYQGQLRDNGTNANGTYTLTFKIYDAVTNGNQIGITITNATTVAGGIFLVSLDFGSGAFDGTARWLDIAVSTNGGATFIGLSPRQQVLPTPYATFAANAAIAASANSVAGTNISGAIGLGQLPVGILTNNASGVILNGSFLGNGAGLTNLVGTVTWQSVPGTNIQAQPNSGYLLTNNSPVIVTLPVAPNPGDIVRISGTGICGW